MTRFQRPRSEDGHSRASSLELVVGVLILAVLAALIAIEEWDFPRRRSATAVSP